MSYAARLMRGESKTLSSKTLLIVTRRQTERSNGEDQPRPSSCLRISGVKLVSLTEISTVTGIIVSTTGHPHFNQHKRDTSTLKLLKKL